MIKVACFPYRCLLGFTHPVSWTKWNTPQLANYMLPLYRRTEACTPLEYSCWSVLDQLGVPHRQIVRQSRASLVILFLSWPKSALHNIHLRPAQGVPSFSRWTQLPSYSLDFSDFSQKPVHPVSKTSGNISSSPSVFFQALLSNLKGRDRQALRH